MASSSQNPRYQDRLARQRGAGTHKVSNAGIEFNFDLPGLALPLGAAPVQTQPQPPQQQTVQERTKSGFSGLEPSAAAAEKRPAGSLPGPESFGSLVAEPPTRRTSPRTNTSESTIPDVNRPTLAGAPRPTNAVPTPAVASVTPEPRGKRRRQPSPDKFLDTPDRREIQQSRQSRLGNGVRDRLAEKRRGAGTHKVVDPGFVIEGIEELAEQARKRLKVTPPPPPPEPQLQTERGSPAEADTEAHKEMAPPGDEMEVEIEPEPVPEAAPEDDPSVNDIGPAATAEEGPEEDEEEEVQLPARRPPRASKKPSPRPPVSEESNAVNTSMQRPRRQKSQGKKPPSPKVTAEEEREAEEAERAALLQAQAEAEAKALRKREARAKTEALAKRRAKAKADALAAAEAEKQAREKARAKAKGKERAATVRPQPEPGPNTESELEEAEETDVESRAVEEEDYQATPPALPQPKKKRKPAAQEQVQDGDESAGDDAAPRRGRRREPGIEVRVWRYARGDQPLPPGWNRKGVNFIDITYSLFMEVIDRHFGTLQRTAEKAAIENFKEELGAKMMIYTEAIENYLNIQTRARQANRRKQQLLQEILEVDKQRRAVAVKQDEVRYNHDTASKKNDRRQRAASAFEDIAGVVELGEARRQIQSPDDADTLDGWEALLNKIQTTVTGGGDDGSGILSQLIEFNLILERTTKALREHNKAI
ncbi:hypothetical protein K440DRAFT_615389 [Wilcoxina mikolae CBS 423.85]|nr:hypothetical protein K440DRAFT_615389 [Wilcoxina mikolae CBS 423.85]